MLPILRNILMTLIYNLGILKYSYDLFKQKLNSIDFQKIFKKKIDLPKV